MWSILRKISMLVSGHQIPWILDVINSPKVYFELKMKNHGYLILILWHFVSAIVRDFLSRNSFRNFLNSEIKITENEILEKKGQRLETVKLNIFFVVRTEVFVIPTVYIWFLTSVWEKFSVGSKEIWFFAWLSKKMDCRNDKSFVVI